MNIGGDFGGKRLGDGEGQEMARRVEVRIGTVRKSIELD